MSNRNNNETCREMLDAVDGFLTDPLVDEVEKKALWDVLTALRGPEGKKDDATRKAIKDAVTGPIRANAFPRTAFQTIEDRPNRAVMTLRRSIDVSGTPKGHFRFHSMEAAKALGITIKGA
jgi:hypothetical protein